MKLKDKQEMFLMNSGSFFLPQYPLWFRCIKPTNNNKIIQTQISISRRLNQQGIEETFTLVGLEGLVALEVQTVVERAAADGGATARRSGGGDVTGEI
ncbi:hypothetical protein F2Q70_00030461 [Brassica cretica]|uniref:Uncharacterized protein n=1 Tax=Brassica cretica TaxID=69181 RepID=A0A8S9FME2_BRACR|nr:hypothetical protein F2Q70_00030461 [Brassica cretica]